MVKDRQFTRINREESRSKRNSDTRLTIKEWFLLARCSCSKCRAMVASDGFLFLKKKSLGTIESFGEGSKWA